MLKGPNHAVHDDFSVSGISRLVTSPASVHNYPLWPFSLIFRMFSHSGPGRAERLTMDVLLPDACSLPEKQEAMTNQQVLQHTISTVQNAMRSVYFTTPWSLTTQYLTNCYLHFGPSQRHSTPQPTVSTAVQLGPRTWTQLFGVTKEKKLFARLCVSKETDVDQFLFAAAHVLRRYRENSHIAGRWHILALQESVVSSTSRHHALVLCGSFSWATWFNKHTFGPDIEVKAIHIPTNKAHCSGWASEAVVSSARFRRIPSQRRIEHVACSSYCHVEEDVDMVDGDFNGASWRCRSGPDPQIESTLGESFKNAEAPCATRLLTFVGAWRNSKRIDKPPNSQSESLSRKHGAFKVNRQDLGLSPKDQTCHHEVFCLVKTC